MADRSGLQERTFTRRFRAATGYQPLDYDQDLHIEAAKTIIDTETTAVEENGAAVGHEDPTSFRRLFKPKAELSPANYRKKFSGIAQGPPHQGPIINTQCLICPVFSHYHYCLKFDSIIALAINVLEWKGFLNLNPHR